MRRVSVSYSGRVQGVGFRATARSIASAFDVTGWVRNEPDGSVTLEAQGRAGEIDLLLDAIRERLGQNIRGERVTDVAPATGETEFRIAH
jgi:acylphosphatase